MIKYLLKHHSVDVHARDRWEGTAYSDAVKHGNKEIADLLKKYETLEIVEEQREA